MTPWWKGYPWRLIQTNLREIDMADIRAEEYVRQLVQMHATVAMINVAGIIASYPTELPFHFQSPYLTGDSLEEIVAACHEQGIRVIARTDFSKVRRPLYEEHPEWASVYADGRIEDYHGNVHVCVNSDYQGYCAPLIAQEAVTRLPVDGIFFNMAGFITRNYSHEYLGICRCASCRRLFAEQFDADLPVAEDMDDPVFRRYRVFKERCVRERTRAMVSAIKAVRPGIAIDRNTVDGEGFARGESNTEIGRPLPHWQYSAADNTSVTVTGWPGWVASNATVDFIGFPARHVAVSPAQQELRLYQSLAFCGGLDYYLIGRLDNHRDRSGYEAVRRVFRFHEAHASPYQGLRPDSDALLVRGDDQDEYRGWFRLLAENHVLFDAVDRGRLAAVDLSGYRGIVLANVRCLSDEEAAAVDQAARAGASVIATHETGFGDGEYEERGSCALGCLGIVRRRLTRTDMRSALLEITHGADFPSMGDRDLVYPGDSFLFADYDESATGRLRLIPPHRYGPPELCYWETVTELPGLVVHPFGAGCGIHLPWLPGRFYHREGYDNALLFVRDVVRSVARLPVAEGNLPPTVMVTRSRRAHEGGTSQVVHLVNNGGHFGTSYFAPPRLRGLEVEVEAAGEPAKITRVRDGGQVPFTRSAELGTVRFAVSELEWYEAFELTW